MAEEKQPSTLTSGASGDIEDEVPATTARSAEDRKAASALASLDSNADSNTPTSSNSVDQDAVNKAMKNLGSGTLGAKDKAKGAAVGGAGSALVKNVKVDQADVALLVEELELSKAKATEILKANEGDAVKALRAYVATA